MTREITLTKKDNICIDDLMSSKILLFLGLFFLVGCATPMVASLDKHQSHYIPASNLNKGLICIYRESEFMGSLRGIYINADGKRIGALNSGTYFVYEADVGEIVISVENWLGKNPSRVIKVEAGKSYYLKAGIKMGGWDAVPYINIVAKEEGEGAIQELVYATMKEKDLRK